MELLFGAFFGAVALKLFEIYLERRDRPYVFDCVHCRNGGHRFIIKANDKILVGQIGDEHKRDIHPYAK